MVTSAAVLLPAAALLLGAASLSPPVPLAATEPPLRLTLPMPVSPPTPLSPPMPLTLPRAADPARQWRATAPAPGGGGGARARDVPHPPEGGGDQRGSSLPRSTLRSGWRWPLSPEPAVTRRFRAPHSEWGAGHRGVDLASRPGQAVLSAAAGRVTHVGVIAGRGTLTVLHRGGVRTTYEPVEARVRLGESVAAGQVIGVVAARGSHCPACLHLGALRGRAYLDPLALLRPGPVVLLPLR